MFHKTFENVILCDDIRREAGNKLTLVGVYPDDFLLDDVPSAIIISLYCEHIANKAGNKKVYFRFRLDDKDVIGISAEVFVPNNNAKALFVIDRFPIPLEKYGTLLLQVSRDQKAWGTVMKKTVKQSPPDP